MLNNPYNSASIFSDFEITPASESDMPWILEVEQEEFSPPWTHGSLLSEIYNCDTFFAIARSDNHNLGFIIMRSVVDTGELLQIVVKKNVRRQGIADELLGAMFEHARSNKVTSIFLEVRKSNEAAISFYNKHHFRLVRIRKDYYTAPTEDAVEMSRGV